MAAALPAMILAACSAAPPSTGPSTVPSAAPSAARVVATATRDDVRVTLTLDGPPRADAPSWATLRIENLGGAGVRWAGGGCGDPGSIGIDLRPAFAPGREWPGLLGRFKTLGLGLDNGRFANPASAGYIAEDRFGKQVACPASLSLLTLAPGAVLEMRAGWDGRIGDPGQPAPSGPAIVSGAFEFIGIVGTVANDVFETKPIQVRIETTVEGKAAASLSPALAIDAALADPQFAAWVQAAPEATWINPSIDLVGGSWSIGLFRQSSGAPTEPYGAVTVDPNGQITGRRFP